MILAGCSGADRQALSGGWRGSLDGIARDGRLRLFPDGRADFSARDGRTIAGGRWRVEDGSLDVRMARVENLAGTLPERRFTGPAVRTQNGMTWLGRSWTRL